MSRQLVIAAFRIAGPNPNPMTAPRRRASNLRMYCWWIGGNARVSVSN